MTTKPKAKKFRIRRDSPMGQAGETSAPDAAASAAASPAPAPAAMGPTDLDAIRREGLTGRQLRMARRVAQKQGLAVTSDFDAVRQLRAAGIDPFQRNTILELVAPEGGIPGQGGPAGQEGAGTQEIGRIQLPQTVATTGSKLPSTISAAAPADTRASDIFNIQRDIAKRRRRKLLVSKKQLSHLWNETQRKGMTLVPLVMYFNHRGMAKIKIGIAKGKKLHDKRETEAKRDWSRQKQRLLKDHG